MSLARRAVRAVRRLLDVVLVERRYVNPSPPLSRGSAPGPHRKAYAPTPWRLLPHLLPPEEVGADEVLVDFGCGSGRVLLEAASRYRFRRVVGVELVPELAAASASLLERNEHLLGGCAWEVVQSDVLDYEVPDDLTVAYMFDPFTGPVFDAVMTRLEASVSRSRRPVRIVYVTPAELERVLRSGRVRRLRAGTTSRLCSFGRYAYFVGELRPGAASDQ
jgi:SAM-dependent methyltransferase